MRKINFVVFGIILLCNLPALAVPRVLEGGWLVDVTRSYAFNRQSPGMTELEYALLSCINAHTELVFKGGEFALNISDAACSSGKKKGVVKGTFTHGIYRIEHDGADSTVIVLENGGGKSTLVIHWLDDSTFWVNDAATSIRLYYKRAGAQP